MKRLIINVDKNVAICINDNPPQTLVPQTTTIVEPFIVDVPQNTPLSSMCKYKKYNISLVTLA